MSRYKHSKYILRAIWFWIGVFSFPVALSQFALGIGGNHDYYADYLLIPSLAIQSKQYPDAFSTKGNILLDSLNNRRIARTTASCGIPLPRSNGGGILSKQLSLTSNDFDQRLLNVLNALESFEASSLELKIGKSKFCSPSFNTYRSPRLRLYSTSVDWQDSDYPEPIRFMLSVYRDRTIAQRRSVPSAMVILYTENVPTKERTIIGYDSHGIYSTLTLFWENDSGFPGTSFFQFGIANDSLSEFQPFYDPDLDELTYTRQGQWVAAGWRISDLRLLRSVAKYLYKTLITGE